MEIDEEIGRILAGGMVTTNAPTARTMTNSVPFEADIDISRIAWKRKDKTPASDSDPWAWGFPTDRDGVILEEAKEIYEACQQYGEVRTGRHVVKLSGRDNGLLNRRIPK